MVSRRYVITRKENISFLNGQKRTSQDISAYFRTFSQLTGTKSCDNLTLFKGFDIALQLATLNQIR